MHSIDYSLDKKTREILANLGSPKEYEPGEIIYLQDEPGIGLVYLAEGRIRNSVFYSDGTEKSLCILEAPSITGETSIIDGGPTVCAAIAITKAKAFLIPREEAQKLLMDNPNLMLLLLKYMAQKMRSMKTQAQEVVSNIPQRLSYMLLNPKKYGIFVHKNHDSRLYITHDELASFIGTTRPKITEHLNRFQKQGLISKGRGYIEIKDYEGLRVIANH